MGWVKSTWGRVGCGLGEKCMGEDGVVWVKSAWGGWDVGWVESAWGEWGVG